jgi:putative ABC transport system substrate-binding protein
MIERREFITLLGGAAAAWPLAARAQQKLPTIGYLGTAAAAAWAPWTAAFVQRLHELGWTDGRTVTIQYRWAEGRADRSAELAAELARLKVDVIVTGGNAALAAKQASSAVPIVFALVDDPVGMGLVASLARPGGNVTGFTVPARRHRREISRDVERDGAAARPCAIMYNPNSVPADGKFFSRPFIESATKLKVRPITAEVHDRSEIENVVTKLGRESGSGLVLVPDNFMSVHRDLIISLTAQFRIPAIYPYGYFAEAGGLVSYGVHAIDQFRRAAEYVSRILRDAKPADLPVQAPTKFELVINLRTAKALGLVIPRILLAGAEQVIE